MTIGRYTVYVSDMGKVVAHAHGIIIVRDARLRAFAKGLEVTVRVMSVRCV